MKKLASLLIALCFTCATAAPVLAQQQALPEEQPSVGAAQATPKKAKKAKKTKKHRKSKTKKSTATQQ